MSLLEQNGGTEHGACLLFELLMQALVVATGMKPRQQFPVRTAQSLRDLGFPVISPGEKVWAVRCHRESQMVVENRNCLTWLQASLQLLLELFG